MVYLAKAGYWGNLNFGITSLLAFLLSIAFANFLPRDVYGVYQYLIALSGIITALTLAGMNSAVTQSVARGYEGDVRASVRIQLLWSIVPFFLGCIGSIYYFLQGNIILGIGLIVIAILSPLTNVFNTYLALLTGKQDFKRIFIYSCVINAIYYPFIFIAILLFKNAAFLVFINLISNTVATAFVYFHTLKIYKPNNNTDPSTIPYGKHLSIMNAFGTIITQLDSILVFHFLGAAELAVYTFSSMVPERVGGLFKFVTTAALPKFSTQTLENIQKTIVSKTIRAALAGIIMTLTYIGLAPFLFHILFPKYIDALPYTELYAIVIATLAANLAATALVTQHRQKELYIYNIVNPIVLLGLQVPLLIFFGIVGILLARVVSNIFNILFSLFLVLRPLKDKRG